MNEFNLKFSKESLSIIEKALVERPFKEVAALLYDINKQLTEQQKPSVSSGSKEKEDG